MSRVYPPILCDIDLYSKHKGGLSGDCLYNANSYYWYYFFCFDI